MYTDSRKACYLRYQSPEMHVSHRLTAIRRLEASSRHTAGLTLEGFTSYPTETLDQASSLD